MTLIQLHYWPGSPTRPSTAFSFQLLDWIEALFLECQVSMQDFTAAFEFLMKSNVLDQVGAEVFGLKIILIVRSYNTCIRICHNMFTQA